MLPIHKYTNTPYILSLIKVIKNKYVYVNIFNVSHVYILY